MGINATPNKQNVAKFLRVQEFPISFNRKRIFFLVFLEQLFVSNLSVSYWDITSILCIFSMDNGACVVAVIKLALI